MKPAGRRAAALDRRHRSPFSTSRPNTLAVAPPCDAGSSASPSSPPSSRSRSARAPGSSSPSRSRSRWRTVERGTIEETITNTRAGTVKAHRRTRLSPESGGMALAIPFDEGQMVKQGDVLLRLDDSLQRAQLAARAARARGRQGAPETELRAGRARAAGGRSQPAPLRTEGHARGRPRRSASGGRSRTSRVRSVGLRRRARRLRRPAWRRSRSTAWC